MGPTAPKQRPWEPAAYDYEDARWCSACVIERLLGRFELRDVSMAMDDEVCLDRLAVALGLDRYDEPSYDSANFPKAVLADQLAGDSQACCACRRELT